MYLCIYVGRSMKSNTLIERNIDETNTLYRNYFIFGNKKNTWNFVKIFHKKIDLFAKKKEIVEISDPFPD